MNTIDVTPASRLSARPDGRISIWEHPEPDLSYVVASDVSEGILHGDWSVACVIRMDNCAQVCEMRDQMDPNDWGRHTAILAAYYNSAILAFETFPAAHGATSHQSALDYGYTNLYYRRQLDTIHKTVTEKPGWRTDSQTNALMVDRVRQAIADESPIRSTFLIEELMGIRFERKQGGSTRNAGQAVWKPVTKTHDDCFDAYAIGLTVRDLYYYEQDRDIPRERRRDASSLQNLAWDEQEEITTRNIYSGRGRGRLYTGY